ncbi:hypothetical protein L7F22_043325 [Adiantum nelumboides]|nr:hypothetical protein [Adiantum nelumboides]
MAETPRPAPGKAPVAFRFRSRTPLAPPLKIFEDPKVKEAPVPPPEPEPATSFKAHEMWNNEVHVAFTKKPKKTLPKPEGTLPKQELERLICYNDRYFKANNTDCVKTKDCMWILIDNVTVHCDLARVINRLADFEEIRDADVQYFEEYILQWLDSLKSKKIQLISTVPILGHTKILTKFKDPEVVFENVLVQKAGSLFTAVKDDRHIVLIQTNSSSFEILDLLYCCLPLPLEKFCISNC